MKSSRTYFSVFLGIVVLFASYYVSQALFAGRSNTSESPITKIFSSGNTPKFAEAPPAGGSGSLVPNVNITQVVTSDFSSEFYSQIDSLDPEKKEDLFTQIKEGNVEGLDLKNIDPDQIGQSLTPDLIGIRTEVSDDEIISDPRNDAEAYRRRYELAVTDIKLFGTQYDVLEVLQKFVGESNSTGFDELISAYTNSYAMLKEIPVPVSVREFHKKNLLFFENTLSIYKALRGFNTDPLRAYIAIQYVDLPAQLLQEIRAMALL